MDYCTTCSLIKTGVKQAFNECIEPVDRSIIQFHEILYHFLRLKETFYFLEVKAARKHFAVPPFTMVFAKKGYITDVEF